jgi:hypothetical protein
VEWPESYIVITAKFSIFLDLNSAALSVMILTGQPNLDKILFSKN